MDVILIIQTAPAWNLVFIIFPRKQHLVRAGSVEWRANRNFGLIKRRKSFGWPSEAAASACIVQKVQKLRSGGAQPFFWRSALLPRFPHSSAKFTINFVSFLLFFLLLPLAFFSFLPFFFFNKRQTFGERYNLPGGSRDAGTFSLLRSETLGAKERTSVAQCTTSAASVVKIPREISGEVRLAVLQPNLHS